MKRICITMAAMALACGLMARIAAAEEVDFSARDLPEEGGSSSDVSTMDKPHAQTSGPILPGDAEWAGIMVIVVLGMFGAAATIGPVVRAVMPVPTPAPADDDHADDHGHDAHTPVAHGGH